MKSKNSEIQKVLSLMKKQGMKSCRDRLDYLNKVVDMRRRITLEKEAPAKSCSEEKLDYKLFKTILYMDDKSIVDLLTAVSSTVMVRKTLLDKFKESLPEGKVRIMIPDFDCFGSALLDFMEELKERATFTLASDNYYAVEIFKKLKLRDKGYKFELWGYDVYMEKEDILPELTGHDAVLLMPFNKMRDEWEYGLERTYYLDGLYNWITKFTNENGISMVILPLSFYRSRKTGICRYKLAESGILREISTIPGKALGMNTNADYAMIRTGKAEGPMYEMIFREYKMDDGVLDVYKKATIAVNEKFKNESARINAWTPHKLMPNSERITCGSFKAKRRLEDMVKIIRGRTFKGGIDNREMKMVNISDIKDGIIDKITNTVYCDTRGFEDFILRKDDILMTIKGTTIKTAIFDIDDRSYITSPNICIIRINSEIKDKDLYSYFLKMYFDLPDGREQLYSIKSGDAVINISKEDIKNLEIPVPNIEEQRELAKRYYDGLEKYKEDLAKIKRAWEELQKDITDKL